MATSRHSRYCHGCETSNYDHCVFFVGYVPFWSWQTRNNEDWKVPVRVYWVEKNMCEAPDEPAPCTTVGDLYYTTEKKYPKKGSVLCQKHWYSIHLDPDSDFYLEEMTPQEFASYQATAWKSHS